MSHAMHGWSKVAGLLIINILMLALVGYGVMEQQSGVTTSSTDMGGNAVDIPQQSNATTPVRPLGSYVAIITRPLFNQDRKPVTASDDIGEDEQAFTLLGVVLTPENTEAVIYSSSQKRAVKLALWDWLDGWRLVEVQAERVVLHKGNRSLEIGLQRSSETNIAVENTR